MNLADGKILDARDSAAVLDELEQRVCATLQTGALGPETVIKACGRRMDEMDEAVYLSAMAELGIDEARGRRYLHEARGLFCEESLRLRLRLELGEGYGEAHTDTPPFQDFRVTRRIIPLGALLHIAAGNADGLPAFSVLEGLLTGNVNILKLPAEEGGISVRLLLELIRIEPALAEYIYVFDYSSKDILNMKKLIAPAEAVVVWGGSEAVRALRSLVPPHIRLIEWGHKVSFAYIAPEGVTDEALGGLARNMAETGQLLCSSAQGVFVDTADLEQVYAFCGRFLPILEREMRGSGQEPGIGLGCRTALKLYTEELESIYRNSRVFRGKNCSLTAYADCALETSIQFGNAWVRPLPRTQLVRALRPYKNYLQTAGLLCAAGEREALARALFAAGCVRVCAPENMSNTWCGAPHDGEYPLRRYTKLAVLDPA